MTQQRATLSMIGFVLVVTLVGLAVRYAKSLNIATPMDTTNISTITITSPAFSDGESIPKQYTCDGDNTSPTLTWTGAPAGTLSYVLLVHDPDSTTHDWLHWLVINLPTTTTNVSAGNIPAGGTELPNDSTTGSYGSPCPAQGEHHYLFEIYALDVATIIANNRTEVEQAIEKHILAKGVLIGRYSR